MKVSKKYVRGMELALLALSLTVGFLLTELAIGYLPLGEKMGWSMVPSVSERVVSIGFQICPGDRRPILTLSSDEFGG
jgi:hypothetical protein